MSSLFDCWFGFIFWGIAFFRMRSTDEDKGRRRNFILDILGVILNVIIILTGVLFLTVGTYASVQGIIDAYAAHTVGGAFSCATNGI